MNIFKIIEITLAIILFIGTLAISTFINMDLIHGESLTIAAFAAVGQFVVASIIVGSIPLIGILTLKMLDDWRYRREARERGL